ncbi:MAG: hypothetical protein MZV63_40055 [Marinilabiliales bacterium]|nr:hypothetical protein [Marinilabiliales bacterium]
MNVHRALDSPTALRGVDARRRTARPSLAAAAEAAGPAAGEVSRCYKMMLGGGFGRRGAVQDFVRQARGDRQGDARHAGQADVVARGGHAARLLPPGEHRAG